MNRREFLRCLGGGCVMGILGCDLLRKKIKPDAAPESKPTGVTKKGKKTGQYGPCGLYCGACGAGDCGGCQTDNHDNCVTDCHFRKCANNKSLKSCAFCEKCPCPKLAEFMTDKWPHHWTVKSNLEYIKNNGMENWLKSQEKEWTCKKCNEPIYWYQTTCSCGNILNSWKLPK